MSSGGLAGGVLGAVGGFFIGGPLGALYGAQLGFGLGMLVDPITPDANVAGKLQAGELNISTAQEGLSIAEIMGSPKLTGNVIGYWNSRSEEVKEEVQGGKGGGGGGQTVTAGYKYYLTWLMGLCMGPVDTFYSIYQNEKCIWEGELDRPVSGGEQTIVIPDFGSVTLYYGTDDQEINTTIQGLVEDSTLVPAYRHQCVIFFDDCFIGEYNRLPVMKFVIKKNTAFDWSANDREAIETYDYNPAHGVYNILSNMIDLPTTFMNEDDFDSAGEALYCEGLGITMLMDRQSEALNYLEQILYHVGAILRFNNDATFSMKLLRKDAVVGFLPIINEDMMLDDLTFGRGSWLSTINDIKIQHLLRYFESEVGGEENVGDGLVDNCEEAAPVLAYLGCIEDSYGYENVAGEYTISGGCGPFTLYYRDENMTAFRKVRDLHSRDFTYWCREVVCAGNGENRYIKIQDKPTSLFSNTLNISVTEAPAFDVPADTEMDPESSEIITISGGRPPYLWQLNGDKVWFDSAFTSKEQQTISKSLTVYSEALDDPSNDETSILTVTDSCLSSDQEFITVTGCCSLLPDGALEFDDDSTADTIAAGGSIDVYVTGGCGPYQWSVSGQGGNLDESETETGVNTLNCTGGTCGVDYDATLTVSCTDACGNEVSGTVRATGGSGHWSGTTYICGTGGGNCGFFGYSNTEYIVGELKYVATWRYTTADACRPDGNCDSTCGPPGTDECNEDARNDYQFMLSAMGVPSATYYRGTTTCTECLDCNIGANTGAFIVIYCFGTQEWIC